MANSGLGRNIKLKQFNLTQKYLEFYWARGFIKSKLGLSSAIHYQVGHLNFCHIWNNVNRSTIISNNDLNS